jgi:hypothetical protein
MSNRNFTPGRTALEASYRNEDERPQWAINSAATAARAQQQPDSKKTFLVVAKKTFGSQTKTILGCLYCRTEDQDRDLVENQREKPQCLLRFF